MREAFGGISLFQIVIVFLLVFTGVMCVTINHSKAFGVKSEIVNIIENKPLSSGNGLEQDTVDEIVTYINESGYRITGNCSDGYIGYDRYGKETGGKDAAICIRPVNVSESYTSDLAGVCTGDCGYLDSDLPAMVYYDIVVFYQIDAPVINNVFNFQLKASTKVLYG